MYAMIFGWDEEKKELTAREETIEGELWPGEPDYPNQEQDNGEINFFED